MRTKKLKPEDFYQLDQQQAKLPIKNAHFYILLTGFYLLLCFMIVFLISSAFY